MAYFIDITQKNDKAVNGYSRTHWKDTRFQDKNKAIEEAHKAFDETENLLMVEVFQEGVARPILILKADGK